MAPRVSVIIAAYHSERVVEGCLAALRKQTFADFETIVVNSSPADRTREIVSRGFPQVRLIESATRLLPHAARNVGVAASSGDLLAFTDADCRPAPDWLEHCVAAQRAGHAALCGSIEPEQTSWFALGVHLCKYSFRLSGLRPRRSAIAGTANACYARELWQRIGPFDGEIFAGDALLGWRAARAGAAPWFEPRAVVRHVFEHSPLEFWRERAARGADFLRARARFEDWSRARLALVALGFPLLALLPLARALGDAIQAGWTARYFWTLPVQVAGHVAWSFGEARAALELLAAHAGGRR